MSSETLINSPEFTSRRATSPVSEFPIEIWQFIFQMVCSDSLQGHFSPIKASEGETRSLSVYFTPFTLSHVCQHWHSILRSQTLIWTDIFIHARTRAPERLLKIWLTRTGSYPLSLWVDVHEDHPSIPVCLKMVRQVHSRWKKISLQFNEAEWAKQRIHLLQMDYDPASLSLAGQISTEYASLEFLEAALHCGVDDDQDDLIFRFRKSANVHTLKLGECRQCLPESIEYIPYPMNLFQLPSVVNLSLSFQFLFPLIRFLNTLALMPNLQSLELSQCTLNISSSPLHRTSIPHLQHLSILDWPKNIEVQTFFRCVDLPSLTSVTMTPSLHTPSFLQMAMSSKCNIQRFHLKSTHLLLHILVPLLATEPFHRLQDFQLEAPEIGNDVLGFLSDTNYPHDFNQTLSRMTLLGCTSDDGLLAKLATWRMQSGYLRHLYIEVMDGLENHPLDIEAMDRLRRSGFDACLQAP